MDEQPGDHCETTAAHSRRWLWPGMVFVLIGLQIAILLVLVAVATSDRSFAVEPQYYQKALHWDDQVAQTRRNQTLGWTLLLEVAAQETPARQRKVTVAANDRDGRPIDDAIVQLTTFHHARAQDRTITTLAFVGNGRYVADIRMARPGLWEFQFSVRHGNELFTTVELRDLPVGIRGGS